MFALQACVALLAACNPRVYTPATAPLPEVTAFVGVNVVPMTENDVVLANYTVLIRGDHIVALGAVGDIIIPRGARRIDGAGKYLIPGLADMHVHLEYFDQPDVLKLFLANGVTTIRNMDGRDYILKWKKAVTDGSLLGPAIYTAGPILDGDPPAVPDNTVVRNAAEAEAKVLEQVSTGYDFIKVYTNLSVEAYRAVLSAARERGVPVAGHVPRGVDLSEALAGGQVAIEHLADLGDWIEADDSPFRNGWHWSKLYVAMAVDTTKLSAASAHIAASGVWIVPTMVQANRAIAPPDTITAWLSAPELTHVGAEGRDFWEERNDRVTARMDAGDWVLVRNGRLNRSRLVQALHTAGARLLVGTDTPNPFVVPGFSVLEELENFVAAGVAPGAALGAATRDAASFLDELTEWGTIEVGKRADLVLLQADPLANIGNVRQRVGVMVRGRWLPEAELRQMIAGLTLR